MQILFTKSKWEMWDSPLPTFLDRVVADGFDGTELYLRTLKEDPQEIALMHEERGLFMIGQILTEGASADDHIRSLHEMVGFALDCRPRSINFHAGRDIFTFDDNVRIFEHIIQQSRQSGVPFLIETHRGRPTFSAIETRRYLEVLPELRLTADFSHWMVVHESDLTDQQANVDTAIERSHHIHARVGYEEGPQIPDPSDPYWSPYVERHLSLWQQIVSKRRAAGASELTITPEFGPPDYMHIQPFTDKPVADAWAANVYMKGLLQQRLVTS
jgi:sugar phosphate isomerase/epimerase